MPKEPDGAARSAPTLTVSTEEAVLFAEISAPPMNLLGPDLVRDLVSLIRCAEANETVKVIVFTSADGAKAALSQADEKHSNGVVHHVDAVLVPPKPGEGADNAQQGK